MSQLKGMLFDRHLRAPNLPKSSCNCILPDPAGSTSPGCGAKGAVTWLNQQLLTCHSMSLHCLGLLT